MLIGYMRVSTGEQSLDLQRDALALIGCERVYDDVCSGRAPDRPGLSRALDVARAGDALVVWARTRPDGFAAAASKEARLRSLRDLDAAALKLLFSLIYN